MITVKMIFTIELKATRCKIAKIRFEYTYNCKFYQ